MGKFEKHEKCIIHNVGNWVGEKHSDMLLEVQMRAIFGVGRGTIL